MGSGVPLVVLASAVYWLFYNKGPAATSAYQIDMGAVRKKAASLRGALPSRVEVEVVSHKTVPRIAPTGGTD